MSGSGACVGEPARAGEGMTENASTTSAIVPLTPRGIASLQPLRRARSQSQSRDGRGGVPPDRPSVQVGPGSLRIRGPAARRGVNEEVVDAPPLVVVARARDLEVCKAPHRARLSLLAGGFG